MFDFSGIELVIFDFDDTLCIHINHGDWINYHKHLLERNVINDYLNTDNCVPMPYMKEFIYKCMESKLKRICLTHAPYDYVMGAKKEFLDFYYGKDAMNDFYCCGRREDKVGFIRTYCNSFYMNPSSVLVVEDHPTTLEEVKQMGCRIMTPQEVAARYLTK